MISALVDSGPGRRAHAFDSAAQLFASFLNLCPCRLENIAVAWITDYLIELRLNPDFQIPDNALFSTIDKGVLPIVIGSAQELVQRERLLARKFDSNLFWKCHSPILPRKKNDAYLTGLISGPEHGRK